MPIGIQQRVSPTASDLMSTNSAIDVESLSHAYGSRVALRDISFRVVPGELFVFLGPNGGGKTTLFRILSTLMPLQTGRVRVFGSDITEQKSQVRRCFGVAFQSPSLDKKLTVEENLAQQAALYGLFGAAFRERRDEVLAQLGLLDRKGERTETLSGGLRRRVDLAKALLHQPRLLLLDEPSTGLDPAARSDLWTYLRRLRQDAGVTVVLTSHLLDEAERADRIAILHEGQFVAEGDPLKLRDSVGGNSIVIEPSVDTESLATQINEQFNLRAQVVDQAIRISCEDGAKCVTQLIDAFPDQIQSIKLGKPTLEDLFISKTGHRFWADKTEEALASR